MSGKNVKTSDESRRDFLKVMVATGGAVVVVGATKALSAAGEPEVHAEPAPEALGYRETPHIREYYAKASF